MQAVTSPQTVINGCMEAADAMGLGRYPLMESLKATIDHFAFCPLDYDEVSRQLGDVLDQSYAVELPLDGKAVMGLQKQEGAPLSWYWGNPLPALAAVSSKNLPLHEGGGYVAIRTNAMSDASNWLRDRDIAFESVRPYGADALWVPLPSYAWSIGPGYYALCVTTETLSETVQRLSVAK